MTTERGDRRPRVDMSPEALDRRLRELSQLHRFGKALEGARRLGTVAEVEARRTGVARS
jgi:hypothetical protein